jgi:DNA-directed RNA polymerase specialized sigma24 family protein
MAGVSTGNERAVSAAADSDPSFADLFARHYLPALRLAALLEGDPTRAEDAVCDAFARVYGRLRRGGVDDVPAYLRRAVVNAVRGSWRRRRELGASPLTSFILRTPPKFDGKRNQNGLRRPGGILSAEVGL